jgi:hypothetical protein
MYNDNYSARFTISVKENAAGGDKNHLLSALAKTLENRAALHLPHSFFFLHHIQLR